MSAPNLLPVHEAQGHILDLVRPLPSESVSIEDALGRALSEQVIAKRTVPPWNNSAMDGYAVRSEDVQSVPARLRVVETVYAGHMPKRTVGASECARIMTGAPIPEGADAVVMQEKTRATEGHVDILESARPGNCVRPLGEDAQAGERLLPQGTPVGIPEAALLWAQGITSVQVHRRPRVAILSTGDELCPAHSVVENRIVDTNGPALALAVARAGGQPVPLGIAKDDPEDVRTKLSPALDCDVVLTTAGVSVGEKDVVRDVLASLGVDMRFWRVAIKPGKPLAAGLRQQTLFVGLPGNPTSSLVTFELFVRPAIRRLLGHADVLPPRIPARTSVALKKAAGLTHFVRVMTEWRDGHLWATPLLSQTSGALRSAQATHLLVIPQEITALSPGDAVELMPVSWGA